MARAMATTTVIVLLSLLVLPALAGQPAKEELVQQLMKLSGLDAQVRQIPLQVMASFGEQKSRLPAEAYELTAQALGTAFDAERMLKTVSKQVETNLDTATMQAALTWLKSGLGRKITGLEEAASTPQAYQQIQTYAKELENRPPPQPRLLLVRRLDVATNATETVVSIAETVTMSVAMALDGIQPKELQTGVERLKKQMELQRPQLRQGLQQEMTAAMLYTYQTCSDAELEQYIGFYESHAGKAYQQGLNVVLKGALLETSVSAGKNLADVVRQLRRKQGA
jgi:hypothetical protein